MIATQGILAKSNLKTIYAQLKSNPDQKDEMAKKIISEINHSDIIYTVEMIQERMKSEESHIIYAIDEINIYGLLINKNEFEIYTCETNIIRAATTAINKKNVLFRTESYNNSIQEFNFQSKIIYDNLIAPIKEKLATQLIIYPTEFLSVIPWDALTPSPADSKMPYFMIFDYEITLKFKLESISRNQPANDNISILSISPTYHGEMYLENQKEQAQIVKGFPHTIVHGNITLNKLITKLSNNESQLIHFSSHAELDSINYNNSGIVLSNTNERLTIETIAMLNINPKMIFLNACNSASTTKQNNFSKSICAAFLKAGANTCIGTLWSIDDSVASKIAVEFYKEIKKGKRTSEAMRWAKLNYLENVVLRSEKHPYHWASFQVYGLNEQLINSHDAKFKNIYSIVFSLLTTVSMLSYYFGYKVKKLALHNNWI